MHEACKLPLSDEEKQKWIQIVAHSVLYHCMILQQLDSVDVQYSALHNLALEWIYLGLYVTNPILNVINI